MQSSSGDRPGPEGRPSGAPLLKVTAVLKKQAVWIGRLLQQFVRLGQRLFIG
jgi:hypothetical protein